MGLGVLQDKSLDHVPGTVTVIGRDFDTPHTYDSRLKYDRSGREPILLVPQPSDNPNDPLNWPLWKRDTILVILCLISIMASALGPILAANTLTLVLVFKKDFTAIALLTGWHLLGVGVAGMIFIASARVWGKRHLYLLGGLLILIGSVWGGAAVSYKSLLGARILQGVGVAPFEALVNASVGDLYHVHQRGKRMALSNLSLFGGAFFSPIIVGKLTHTLGWPWTFYLVAIFTGTILPFIFLFVPETAFRRDDYLNIDMAQDDFSATENLEHAGQSAPPYELSASRPNDEKHLSTPERDEPLSAASAQTQATSTSILKQAPNAKPEKDRFVKTLRPFNGRKTDDSFLKLFLRPFPLFMHPAILWACLIQGTLIGWTVFIGVILAAIFIGPPLYFGEVQVGYLYSGAFIGAVLGFLISGLLADWSARALTRRNNGVYEPEFRLVLVIPQMVFGCIGLYGIGYACENVGRYGWFLPDMFFAFEVLGMVCGAVCSSLYIVDAHREIAVEAFTCMMIFKNIFSFGLTWSAYGWLLEAGIARTFYIIGSVQVVVCLTTIPLYIFGKKNRSFFHRHNILKIFGLA